MTDDFNNWWNDNVFTKNNPYTNDTPAFWAWEGWHAAIAAERKKFCSDLAGLHDVYSLQSVGGIRARGQHD